MQSIPVRFRLSTDSDSYREVTAVFTSRETHPTNSADKRMCYAHVGQHSECSLAWVDERTRAATPAEYDSLLRELRQIYEGDSVDVRLVVEP
jgi:hypothetical protein